MNRHNGAQVTNGTEVRVFGLRRTGNHALIGWITDHFSAPKLHLNNIGDNLANPWRTFSSAVLDGLCIKSQRRWNWIRRSLRAHGSQKIYNHSHRLDLSDLRRQKKELLVLSYEDVSLMNPRVQEFLAASEQFVARSESHFNLLILRDPYNHFASLIKSGFVDNTSCPFYLHLWKEYAHEFLCHTQLLGTNKICVSYNRWVKDDEYRKRIAECLGFKTTGAAYTQVSDFGGGSSFQGEETDANQLDVFNRWKSVSDSPVFLQILRDKEIRELAREVFDVVAVGQDLAEIL